MALNAKNKLGFVDGTLTKPTNDDVAAKLWERCSDMVLSWLLNSINKSLTGCLIYCNTPQEVWLDLESGFSQSNNPRIFRLKRDIATLRQDAMPIAQYYNTIKQYWEELVALQSMPTCTCGGLQELVNIQVVERVFQFLMGLNDSYAQIRS
ncbi:uncharacterized protein LOC121265712 [Juglans microcarpa x Juglans regia]|uniref:uncharacterized protein LOC121265712 n=1 Tax=Juglans microcarpa x Juglans regia TaxID=2249226 RepID=UPI001B7D920B|nr:uncharacterized protein LOC121265712 [Juglans microcarpa x Juglans regia]